MDNYVNWKKFPVHAVTSDTLVSAPEFFEWAGQVAATGLAALNLRAHGLTGRRLFEVASRLRQLTTAHGVPLIVSGRLDIALAAGADAVQLSVHTVPLESAAKLCRARELQFGFSCHSEWEALEARDAGASYIYLGTVFSSASKPGTPPCGIGLLAKIVKLIDIPVVAIGGIEPGNAADIAAAGAAAAAAITSIWNAPSPGEAVRALAAYFGHNG